jgi:hypothetical protein
VRRAHLDLWVERITSATSSPANPESPPADAPRQHPRACRSVQTHSAQQSSSPSGHSPESRPAKPANPHADPQEHARWPLEPQLGRSDLPRAASPPKLPWPKKYHEPKSGANRPLTSRGLLRFLPSLITGFGICCGPSLQSQAQRGVYSRDSDYEVCYHHRRRMDRDTVNHPESGGRGLDPASVAASLKKYELEKTAVAVQPIALSHARKTSCRSAFRHSPP